jgi:hypothetical protein
MTNPNSLGAEERYKLVLTLINNSKANYRKVARLLNRLRRQLRPYRHICRETQLAQAELDAKQALKDTRLPDELKVALKQTMTEEFHFNFA